MKLLVYGREAGFPPLEKSCKFIRALPCRNTAPRAIVLPEFFNALEFRIFEAEQFLASVPLCSGHPIDTTLFPI